MSDPLFWIILWNLGCAADATRKGCKGWAIVLTATAVLGMVTFIAKRT